MKGKNTTIRNTVWIISCKIVQALLGVIINMFSARFLGPSNYGIISYAASVTAFALPVAQLGFKSTLVCEIHEHPDKEGKTVGTALIFSLFSSFICIVGISIFVCIANPNETVTFIVCILYSISLLVQALEMIQYWFQAKLISQYTSLTSLFAYVLVSVYKIYLLATGKNIFWFAVTYAIDHMIIAIVLIIFYFKLGAQKLSISFTRFKEMFSLSKHFIISGLMVTIFAQTDKIMLKFMVSDEAVGIYSVAVNCAGMTSFIFAAIIDSFRPLIYENKKKDKMTYEKSLTMCYSVVIWLSLAQSFLMAIFSKFIIQVMYGAEYIASADVLCLIVWYTTFSYLGAIRNIWMLAENKQKYLWVINMLGALANIVLNAIMIPVKGVHGAALASLITQIFTNFVIGFIIKPIRPNNLILINGLNPRMLLSYIKNK